MQAERSDATIQNTMVKPNCENSWPDIPFSSASGRNTTQVVAVEPVTESTT